MIKIDVRNLFKYLLNLDSVDFYISNVFVFFFIFIILLVILINIVFIKLIKLRVMM